ncbi:RNA polymerase sigma factor [Herbaspirillum chlorophenolicum]|uniref:RNA polymerase sigma factor n=1 Tax=Herbaspirillum chlorophenolicum TaxID=211589 RepID=A0ABW8F5F2_9BURK
MALDDNTPALLRKLLVNGYADLRSRLKRRFGSEEIADDVLHETWLRVDRMNDPGPVRSPLAYLLRIAMNIAEDRRQSQGRLLDFVEIDELLHFSDETHDPMRITEARAEIGAVERALAELPARRREIFLASRIDETPHKEIAARHGVSIRIVEREVKAALVHCAERLDRDVIQRFGPGAGKQS